MFCPFWEEIFQNHVIFSDVSFGGIKTMSIQVQLIIFGWELMVRPRQLSKTTPKQRSSIQVPGPRNPLVVFCLWGKHYGYSKKIGNCGIDVSKVWYFPYSKFIFGISPIPSQVPGACSPSNFSSCHGAWHVASHSWAVRSRGALHVPRQGRGLAAAESDMRKSPSSSGWFSCLDVHPR